MYKRYCPKCGQEVDYNLDKCTNCGTAVEKLEYVKTHTIEHKGIKYAGFWIRLLASIIDDIVLLSFIFLFEYLVGIENIFIGILFPIFLYYAYFESSIKQGTLGKQVVGIKVVDGSGNRISFAKASIRSILRFIFINLMTLGFVAVIFTKKKQGFHDMTIDTYVVYK